ncbi:MAG TPA: hypothetical protein PK954_12210 [Anaerolineales bacterium]|nr:hypothetical protein [Anaerolineales bacterium]HRF49171.1 hypothetical protein [Anaerolineales bacterium]
MSLGRGAAWLYGAGLCVIFGLGATLDATLARANGPYPLIHVTATPWMWGVGPLTGWWAWSPLWLAGLGALLAGGLGRSSAGPRVGQWITLHWRWVALLAAVLACAGFWFWRVANSEGDAFKYLIMLRDDRWFVMSQPLSTALFSLGYGLLEPVGWPPAAAAAAVNVFAGAVWVVVVLALARTTPVAPLAIASAVVAGGVVVCFGYIETMAWPLAIASGYAWAAQRALSGASPWPVAVLFGLAVAAHGQMLLLGPSLLVVAYVVWRSRGVGSVLAFAGLSAAPIVLIVAVALMNQGHIYDTLVGDVLGGGDRRMFVPLTTAAVTTERYTLLSGWHLWELAQLTLRTAPWLPLVTLGAVLGQRKTARTVRSLFWVLVFVGSLLFLILWNADFGLHKDWDLYAPPMMLAALAAVMLWPEGWRPTRVETGLGVGLSCGATAVTLLTFAPIASWDPWNVDAVLAGRPVYVRYGEVAELVGVEAPAWSARAGEDWSVTTTWRLRQPTRVQYTSAVHVVAQGPDGPVLVAQHDARPIAPTHWPNPRFTDEWIVGELVPDTHRVSLAADIASGEYEVWAVLYDLTTGQRLASVTGDHEVIGTLTVSGP